MVRRNIDRFTVDGYIAVEKVKDGFLVYDDDGAFKCKVFNIEATKMVLDYKRSVDSKTADEWTGFVSGDAVLCEKVKVE